MKSFSIFKYLRIENGARVSTANPLPLKNSCQGLPHPQKLPEGVMLVRAARAGRGARFFGRPRGQLLLVSCSLVVPQVDGRHLLRLRAQGAARAVAGRARDRGLQAGSGG
jgi:hypothetical protein